MNNQTILAVDHLGRIHLSKDICRSIGITGSMEGLYVGILRHGIAIGSEMPLDCIYSYPVKPDGMGRVPLNVYVKAALGLTPPDRIAIDRINEGNFFIGRRHVTSIRDLTVQSHADELGRVFIPTPILREISEEKPEGLYIRQYSVNGTNCITASVSDPEGQYRGLGEDLSFIDIKEELELLHIASPCAVLLRTGDQQITITKA